MIIVGDVARFIGAFEPDFLEIMNQFVSNIERNKVPERAEPSWPRPKLKKYLSSVINISLASSNIAIRNDGDEISVDLPQVRFCIFSKDKNQLQTRLYTSGMSNLALDMDLPTFISNPISMVKCPTSLQVNLSQVEASTTIANKVIFLRHYYFVRIFCSTLLLRRKFSERSDKKKTAFKKVSTK